LPSVLLIAEARTDNTAVRLLFCSGQVLRVECGS
jgi:hypothetical protein